MMRRESMTFQVPGHLLLSGTSLLLIVLASSIALLHGAEDQTGETTAAIVRSFQAALSTSLRRTRAPENTAAFTLSSIQGRAANRENWLPLPTMDQDEFPGQPEPTVPQDHLSRERMLFHNTFIELQRFSDVVTSEILRPQGSFEIGFSAVQTGDDNVALQITDAICQANADATRRNTEWELTVWSTSPADSAWIRAAQEASKLRRRVTELVTSRGISNVRITAASRLWISRTSPRPRMTVTIRHIDPTQ
jgi:hypothetical protein